MEQQNLLHLAALLHDIGKFRQRATDHDTPHQDHSHEFVNNDFADFFAPCGDAFKNAIRNHHQNPTQLQHLIEKQVILADRLSTTESEDEEGEDSVQSALVSILSRLKGADKEYRYQLTALNFDKETVIPTETADVNRDAYAKLWADFKAAFSKATKDAIYTPAHYQTIVALLHKYTARMPSAKREQETIPDISLYDHLRTTAAIAACIGQELTEISKVDALLNDPENSDQKICALIKGDISGIQHFLYHILPGGAANQLRGRSFYLQLLTETIAHWVLKQFDLPITNLILASGGHFFILAPWTDAAEKLSTFHQKISEKLWTLHKVNLSCILDSVAITANDFKPENFSDKWDAVSEKVQHRKQQKWTEMGNEAMFQNIFEPYENQEVNWKFEELGKQLRNAKYLISYDISESDIPAEPTWHDAIQAFGTAAHLCQEVDEKPGPENAEHATIYRIGDTDLLKDMEKNESTHIPISYDFRLFKPVIAHRHNTDDPEKIANYDYLADASEGVRYLGALRMDVDNLGAVFTEQLQNASISQHVTLSEAFRHFFEGYVPQLCYEYNRKYFKKHGKEIIELIYAGGDDLFLIGGWSALPEIAQIIRSEFHNFVTGDHITLSGGITIDQLKFPLYQFAEQSGNAEKTSKNLEGKNAITFLQTTMSWNNFNYATQWHNKFLGALRDKRPLSKDILTRLGQIYEDKDRWAWRSIYYFHRLQERYKYSEKKTFISELKHELNHGSSPRLREFIHIVIRWTTLRIRDLR